MLTAASAGAGRPRRDMPRKAVPDPPEPRPTPPPPPPPLPPCTPSKPSSSSSLGLLDSLDAVSRSSATSALRRARCSGAPTLAPAAIAARASTGIPLLSPRPPPPPLPLTPPPSALSAKDGMSRVTPPRGRGSPSTACPDDRPLCNNNTPFPRRTPLSPTAPPLSLSLSAATAASTPLSCTPPPPPVVPTCLLPRATTARPSSGVPTSSLLSSEPSAPPRRPSPPPRPPTPALAASAGPVDPAPDRRVAAGAVGDQAAVARPKGVTAPGEVDTTGGDETGQPKGIAPPRPAARQHTTPARAPHTHTSPSESAMTRLHSMNSSKRG